jgi:hypothetical protein
MRAVVAERAENRYAGATRGVLARSPAARIVRTAVAAARTGAMRLLPGKGTPG